MPYEPHSTTHNPHHTLCPLISPMKPHQTRALTSQQQQEQPVQSASQPVSATRAFEVQVSLSRSSFQFVFVSLTRWSDRWSFPVCSKVGVPLSLPLACCTASIGNCKDGMMIIWCVCSIIVIIGMFYCEFRWLLGWSDGVMCVCTMQGLPRVVQMGFYNYFSVLCWLLTSLVLGRVFLFIRLYIWSFYSFRNLGRDSNSTDSGHWSFHLHRPLLVSIKSSEHY